MDSQSSNILLCNVLAILETQGISEKDFLKSADLSASYLSDWKAGKNKNPSVYKIHRIASALSTSIDYLLTGNLQQSEHDISTFQATELSVDEQNLINTYRETNKDGKVLIQKSIRKIWSNHQITKGESSSSSTNKYVG